MVNSVAWCQGQFQPQLLRLVAVMLSEVRVIVVTGLLLPSMYLG